MPRLTNLPNISWLFAVLLVLLASPTVSAVRINVTNCLPEGFLSNDPPYLQWVPFEADAKFDTQSDKHNFQFIVWGNVKGSQDRRLLPPPNSGEWANDNFTEGKIVNSVNEQNGTTVKSSISMLSYVPYSHRNFFCTEALVGGHCPLAPVFNTTGKV